MLVDVCGRSDGKTYRMLELIAQMPDPKKALVIYISNREARRIQGLWRDLYPDSGIPLFIAASRSGARPFLGINRVFVDNADLLLQEMIGSRIDYATMTGSVKGGFPE